MQLPEQALLQVAELTEQAGFAEVKRAAEEISEAYREGRDPPIATRPRVTAYAATRMPATYAAVVSVLGEVKHRIGELPVTSVLDVGAGTGAASLAAQRWFAPQRLTMLERNSAMAAAAAAFIPEADIRREDFTRPDSLPAHDVVIAAYALGEGANLEALDRLWQAALSLLVLIEPGSPKGFATILEARRRLLEMGAHIVAPCPGPVVCPLADKDWCHFGARVERSSLHRRLKTAELNYEDEKFSYIAVTREAVEPAAARIVRRPLHRPGLIVIETCTPSGIEVVRAGKRERQIFRAARRAAWGEEWRPHEH